MRGLKVLAFAAVSLLLMACASGPSVVEKDDPSAVPSAASAVPEWEPQSRRLAVCAGGDCAQHGIGDDGTHGGTAIDNAAGLCRE